MPVWKRAEERATPSDRKALLFGFSTRSAGRHILLLAVILAALGCTPPETPGPDGRSSPFLFHVDEVGHKPYMDEAVWELIGDLNENTELTAPHYFWQQIEAEKDQYDWSALEDFIGTNPDRFLVLFVGPGFIQTGDGDFSMVGNIPSWIDNRYSNPELKEQYGELLQELVSHYRDEIFMWWIGHEVNMGGSEQAFSWVMWKDWLSWQTGMMKAVDPQVRIAISFGSWTNYHEQMPPNAIHEVDGALELVQEGIDFDIIAIEYHYGSRQEGNLNALRSALDELKSVGKQIFIWEVYYPGGTDFAYQEAWGWAFPPEGGYSEQWQADCLSETLRLAHGDPQIAGVNMFHVLEVTYSEYPADNSESGWRCFAGLIRADGTPKVAYYRVRDCWNTLR